MSIDSYLTLIELREMLKQLVHCICERPIGCPFPLHVSITALRLLLADAAT